MLTVHDERADFTQKLVAVLEELESLANLPSLLDDAIPFIPRQRDYGAFWQKAKEVAGFFRGGGLHREDRERLWARQRGLCEQVRDLQSREREGRANESRRNRESILFLLREARNWAKGAERLDHLQEARRRLSEAMGLMKEKLLLRDDREECWTLWQEVNGLARIRRREIVRDLLENKLGHLEAVIERNEGLVERIRGEINDLEAKIVCAWNEEWAERARGWVQGKYARIAVIEWRNLELEEKMQEIRSNFASLARSGSS